MMFDYSRSIDKDTPYVSPQQKYHTRLFREDRICEEMERFFRDLYDKQGDFHIIDLSVLNGNQVLLVYSTPY